MLDDLCLERRGDGARELGPAHAEAPHGVGRARQAHAAKAREPADHLQDGSLQRSGHVLPVGVHVGQAMQDRAHLLLGQAIIRQDALEGHDDAVHHDLRQVHEAYARKPQPVHEVTRFLRRKVISTADKRVYHHFLESRSEGGPFGMHDAQGVDDVGNALRHAVEAAQVGGVEQEADRLIGRLVQVGQVCPGGFHQHEAVDGSRHALPSHGGQGRERGALDRVLQARREGLPGALHASQAAPHNERHSKGQSRDVDERRRGARGARGAEGRRGAGGGGGGLRIDDVGDFLLIHPLDGVEQALFDRVLGLRR